MLRYWPLLFGLSFALLAASCRGETGSAHLIRVVAAEQTWERPAQLILRGEGFPQGMRGEALLEGTLFAAGSAPKQVALSLPCRALGPNQAQIDLADGATGSGEGPFEGRIELRFGTRAAGRLVGSLDHALVRIGTAPSLEAQFASTQRARAYQRSVGIAALELAHGGLSVSELDPSGAAREAGLSTGDLIVRLDGRPLQLPRDLIAVTASRGGELEVKRPGQNATRVVVISRGRSRQGPVWSLWGLCGALGAGLASVLCRAMSPAGTWIYRRDRRRELLLSCCCVVSLLCLLLFMVGELESVQRSAAHAFLFGALLASAWVWLWRRLAPTLRTTKDPTLLPLL